MHFLGIDQSLTSTGIVVIDDEKDQAVCATYVGSKTERGAERLAHIGNRIRSLIEEFKPFPMAAIEGYSIGSQNRPFDLGEIGGIVRYMLFTHDVPFLVVAPSALKKFMAGSGKASKEDVAKEVVKQSQQQFARNDGTDAYALARIARAYASPEQHCHGRAQTEVIHELRKSKGLVISAVGKPTNKLSV